jgi:hypothetical protein
MRFVEDVVGTCTDRCRVGIANVLDGQRDLSTEVGCSFAGQRTK